jgi:tyrosine-protein kinase Etk/Wzc
MANYKMKTEKQNKVEVENLYYIAEDSVSISDVILVLARQLKVIILVPIFFCFVGVIYALFLATPIFTSTAKIMSSSTSGGGMLQAAGLAAQFGISVPSIQNEQKWAYPEIIRSRTLARSLLKRKFDTIKFGPSKKLKNILTHNKDYSEIGLNIQEVEAVDKLLSMIGISEDLKTGIITLSIDAEEAELAFEVNSMLIEELDSHQQKYNKTKTSEAKRFIEERIIDVEKKLIESEEDLKVFNDRNRRIGNSPGLQLEQQRLSREVAVLIGVFTTLKQQLETTKIEEVKDSDYVIVFDPPEVPLEKSRPKRKNIVILAGFLGLGFGLFIALTREYLFRFQKEENIKIEEIKTLVWKNFSEIFPWISRN